jgi:hypothetical protein
MDKRGIGHKWGKEVSEALDIKQILLFHQDLKNSKICSYPQKL